MDITDTLAPKSDQLDYDDFIAGDRTFTIGEVRRGPSAEQPVEVVMNEFDRPWRPAKSMRRVLAAAWGADAAKYIGRSITLFGDPSVKWAGQEVGGIRVRALSDIDGPLTIALTVTRAKRAPFVVQPLTPAKPVKDTSGRDWLTELADTNGDLDLINTLGIAAKTAGAQPTVLEIIRQASRAAKAELDTPS